MNKESTSHIKNTESDEFEESEGIIINDIYKIHTEKKVGNGAFGEIYYGINLSTSEEVAVKLETTRTPQPQIFSEAKILTAIQGGEGIPRIHWSGSQGNYNILIMDFLGPSIEELKRYCDNVFSLKTTLQVCEQMVSRIEYIHSKGYIHRDVKPDNFVMGTKNKKYQLYIIDYGLAKRYLDQKNMHIPFKEGKSLTGTARYSSIWTHLGKEQSRRDDIESLAYIMIYLYKGSLPWQGIKVKNIKEKYNKIMEMKSTISLEELCKDCPEEMLMFVNYARSIQFTEKPDYTFIRSLFKSISMVHKISYDFFIYDWTTFKPKKHEEKEEKEMQFYNKIINFLNGKPFYFSDNLEEIQKIIIFKEEESESHENDIEEAVMKQSNNAKSQLNVIPKSMNQKTASPAKSNSSLIRNSSSSPRKK